MQCLLFSWRFAGHYFLPWHMPAVSLEMLQPWISLLTQRTLYFSPLTCKCHIKLNMQVFEFFFWRGKGTKLLEHFTLQRQVPTFFYKYDVFFVWLLSIFLGLYGKEVVTAYYWIERIRKKTCTVIDRTGSFRMSRPFQKSICPMLLMTILKIYSLSKLAKECKEPWDFRYSNMYFIENQCL